MMLASGPWVVAEQHQIRMAGVDRAITITVDVPDGLPIQLWFTPDEALDLAADLKHVVVGRKRVP